MYEFNCLPFGLASAPYVFTKLTRPVLTYLRSRGCISVNYLDDFLIIESTAEQCKDNIDFTSKLLQSLGFIINFEKSLTTPRRVCTFLGFELNSQTSTLGIPQEKRNKIFLLIRHFKELRQCSIRKLAHFIGVIISICLTVAYGWVHTKILNVINI